MKIDVKGVIVSNDDKPIYDLFDMESTSPSVITDALKEADGKDVEIIVNSGGGDLFAGSHIFSELKSYEGNVEAKITGVAASSASIIAMGADTVKMSPTASLMIHNVSMVASGNSNDFQHASDTLKTLNKTVANAYMDKTGMSQDELLNMMDDETWLSSDEAHSKGFVDEILFRQDKFAAASEYMIPPKVVEGVRNTLMKQKLRNEEETQEEKQEETFTSEQKQAIRNIVKDEIKKQIEKDEPEEQKEEPDNSVVVNGVKYVAESKMNKHKRWL